MKASENKFLLLKPGVKLTHVIEPVIVSLDKYFKEINKVAYVTSGLRDPEEQLQIIRGYLVSKGLKDQHKEAFGKCSSAKINSDKYGLIYSWQIGWSKLLNMGVIINPPFAAGCLMDYIRNGVNKKGLVISGSPHFKGTAFDIGGSSNGIEDELPAIKKAFADKVPGLVGYLPERENNAIHLDCKTF
jgi:hypothetical protein